MQTSLFPEYHFVPKSRGKILNDKIWPELTVHQKINIRSHNCKEKDLSRLAPNYMYLTACFNGGLDKSPHKLYGRDCYGDCFYLLKLTRKLRNV